ncbi:MAG: ATP-binding cassette domain-containing protein [Humibacter sp.]
MTERVQTELLRVEGVDVAYGRGASRRQVLFDAHLTVQKGEIVGLIGETGSGKSTLARTVLGLVSPTKGSVQIEGNEVTRLSARQRREFRRTGVANYVFQDPLRSLDPEATLRQSVAEPLLVRGGLSRAEIEQRVRTQFDRVLLDADLLDRLPGQVSGGQRQRAAIARALITEPSLLILDEPVSALDSANRVQILELLQRLAGPEVGLLFISHDLGSVAGITDRVVVLYRGRVVDSGTTRDVISSPAHPYSRLLVGSAPTVAGASSTREWRASLREEIDQLEAG